jgi:hypothetical protein
MIFRKRQTRRKAGTQSHWCQTKFSIWLGIAGLPKVGLFLNPPFASQQRVGFVLGQKRGANVKRFNIDVIEEREIL